MKFSSIFTVLFAGTALAATPTAPESPSLVRRDAATISSAVSTIQARVVSLGTSIDAYTGSAQSAALQSASDAVIASINDANTRIAPTSSISFGEALALSNQIDELIAQIKSAVDKAINKKSLFVANGDGNRVYTALVNQRSASQRLIPTVTSKVPAAAQGLAQQRAQGIITELNRGVDAFADQARRAARGAARL